MGHNSVMRPLIALLGQTNNMSVVQCEIDGSIKVEKITKEILFMVTHVVVLVENSSHAIRAKKALEENEAAYSQIIPLIRY